MAILKKLTFTIVLAALASLGSAFAPTTTTTTRSTTLFLQKSVQDAIAEAQQICNTQGAASEACRVAWDIVEELEAADSHKNANTNAVANNASPDISVLLASFDILCQKIDGKMEQLKATTVNFHELGASDPAIEDLYQKAQEMQAALTNVKATLRH